MCTIVLMWQGRHACNQRSKDKEGNRKNQHINQATSLSSGTKRKEEGMQTRNKGDSVNKKKTTATNAIANFR